MNIQENLPKESNLKLIILHLFPGLLMLVFLVVLTPIVNKLGFPAIFSNFLCVALILIPFQLGYMLFQGRKINGYSSLKGIVLNQEKIPIWQYFIIVPILLCWASLMYGLISEPLDKYLIANFFSFMPNWLFTGVNDPQQYTQTALSITCITGLLLNGFAAPIVEEMYFRGYLMPRLTKYKSWTPFINVVLFSLYHFFSPWQNVERILAVLPMGYAVWWKKNIYISIFTHCTVNTISMILLFKSFLY